MRCILPNHGSTFYWYLFIYRIIITNIKSACGCSKGSMTRRICNKESYFLKVPHIQAQD